MLAPQAYPLALAAFASFLEAVSGITLDISTTGGNASSPILFGFMFEDINNSGDGGLHGQLLQNNGFQGTSPNLTAYAAVGDATIALDTEHPLSSAIPNSLRVDVASGTTGHVGFSNAGYSGIPVTDDTMASYLFVEGDYVGDLTIQVVSSADGTVFGESVVAVESNSSAFTYVQTSFDTTAAPDANNLWTVTFDATSVAGGSLFNGLRLSIANALDAVGGTFLRFPGGNNLEGATVANRWIWNNTIGPLQDRPGRQGDWTYPNTDALGLLEYLYWCKDMNLLPVMAVWDGLTLGGGVITDLTELQPYIQTALDQIEYVIGESSSTPNGALRARDGHPDPFPLRAVEIGNEDFLNNGPASYASRFTAFYDAITGVYPNLTVIASSDQGLPDPMLPGSWIDIHHYLSPDEFISSFDEFDNYDRNFGIFVGEYACTTSNSGSRFALPTLIGSVSEAVYMIGLEKNSDVVQMAAYAPLLQNLDNTQWTPDLVSFTSDPADLTLSSSYYVQQMFAQNRGTTTLPVTSDTAFGPAYWVASQADSGDIIVKLANYGATVQSVTVNAADKTTGAVTTLTGPSENSFNSPGNATVTPKQSSVAGTDGAFTLQLPAWSVVIAVLS